MPIDAAALVGLWEKLLWPLLRVGGVMLAAPVFGARFVPVRLRLLFSVALTLVLLPLWPATPAMELFSAQWILGIATELTVGIGIGFLLQLVFEAVMLAGEVLAFATGLSFAQLVDPLSGGEASALSQLFLVLSSLLFVALDGHHALITALAASFTTLPPGAIGAAAAGPLLEFSSQLFAGGIAIALPAMMALMIVNLGFGVMSRAAPALNLFAVGFPLSLLLGLVVLQLSLPSLQGVFAGLLRSAWTLIGGAHV